MNGSWLCDAEGRRRLVENSSRVRPMRAATMGILLVVLLATVPQDGWWPLAPLAVAAAGFQWADRQIASNPRPEVPFAIAWVLAQACIAGSAALLGGSRHVALTWLAIPIVTVSARLTVRGLVAAVVVTEALLVATSLAVDAAYVAARPDSVLFPAAAVAGIALLSSALMRSDLHHRTASVIDPLTQMLNRNALMVRAGELAQQSEVIGDPVAVVVADLDRFKQVNDSHGHGTGDAVLREVAYRIRKALRAFDLVYRLGGEEFVVLLPGADAAEAGELAERIRRAVGDEPVAGVPVTISLGVAASPRGRAFDFDAVFAAADFALYEAKQGGRDRVSGTPAGGVPEPALTPSD